jgi:hypothetical protein
MEYMESRMDDQITGAQLDQYEAEKEVWAIIFEDNDVKPEIFMGDGCESAAKERFKQCLVRWNCHLLTNATMQDTVPRSELEHPLENTGLAELMIKDLRTELEAAQELVTGQDGIIKELADALRNLSFNAQTTGGIAGRDESLVAATTEANHALAMPRIGRAYNRSVEAQGRIKELDSENSLLKKNAEVGAAIQRACGELPEGFDIHIELENGAGGVCLYEPNSDVSFDEFDADTFAGQINKAIDHAIGIAVTYEAIGGEA